MFIVKMPVLEDRIITDAMSNLNLCEKDARSDD